MVLAGCEPSVWDPRTSFLNPGKQYKAPKQSLTLPIQETISVIDPATELLPNATSPTPEDRVVIEEDYRLVARDVLEVTIMNLYGRGTPDTVRVQVSDTGFIRVPLINEPIKAVGMTEEQLRDKLVSLYVPSIVQWPQITVQFLTQRGNVFVLTGAVPRPATYELSRPDLRLLEALGQGGGLPSTLIKYIYVIRERSQELAAAPSPAAAEPAEKPAAPQEPANDLQHQRQRALDEFQKALEQLQTAPATPSRLPHLTEMAQKPGALPTAAMTPLDEPVSGPNKKWVYDARTREYRQVTIEAPAVAAAPRTAALAASATQPVTSPDQATPADESSATAPAAQEEEKEPFGWANAAEAKGNRVIAIETTALNRGDARVNIVVRPGDVIMVPTLELGQFFMAGEVARPGAYELQGRKMTVKQALAAAGGLGELAWPKNALLIRRIGENEEQVIPLDLVAIMRNRQPDIFLKPNDQIAVGSQACTPFLATIRNAFRFSWGGGLVYDRNFGAPFEGPLNSQRFKQW